MTYRPGVRLVKFLTLNRVYAVEKGGVLRWITSETLVRALYGLNWNRNVDDIEDVFTRTINLVRILRQIANFHP